jgi:hypothetical protein
VRWQPQAGTNAGTSDTELSSTMNSESNARVNAEGQSLFKRIQRALAASDPPLGRARLDNKKAPA